MESKCGTIDHFLIRWGLSRVLVKKKNPLNYIQCLAKTWVACNKVTNEMKQGELSNFRMSLN